MSASIQNAVPGAAAATASAMPRRASRRRLLLSFIAVLLARGLGLVLGLAVAVLLANRLGAGASSDAFFFARRLTLGASDAIRRVIANGYIPAVVADIKERGQRSAILIWRKRFGRLLVAALLAAILVAWAAPVVVALIAPGFSTGVASEASLLLRIMAFMIPISLTLAALATFLLASRRFGLPEAMSELPRVLTVTALLLLVPPFGVTVLALALLLGAGLAATSLATIAWRQVRQEPPRDPGRDVTPEQASGRAPGRLLPAAVMHVYSQASLWIAFGFASMLGTGSLSIFEYGIRLTTLLPSVLVTSFVSVAYIELAHRSDEVATQLAANAMRSLRAAAFVALPLVTFIAVAAELLVDLVLEHGLFDQASAQETIRVVRFYSPAVAVGVITNILLIGIYADPKAPHLRIALSAAVAGLVLRVALMLPAIDAFGLVGLPLGASLADAAVLVLLSALVARHWPGFFTGADLRALAQIALAAAAAGATAHLVFRALAPAGIWLEIGALIGAAGAAAVVYLLAAFFLRIHEIHLVRSQLPFGRRNRADAAQP